MSSWLTTNDVLLFQLVVREKLCALHQSDKSEAELAVRAEADEIKVGLVGLSIDQDQVGPYVTIAVIAPLAA